MTHTLRRADKGEADYLREKSERSAREPGEIRVDRVEVQRKRHAARALAAQERALLSLGATG